MVLTSKFYICFIRTFDASQSNNCTFNFSQGNNCSYILLKTYIKETKCAVYSTLLQHTQLLLSIIILRNIKSAVIALRNIKGAAITLRNIKSADQSYTEFLMSITSKMSSKLVVSFAFPNHLIDP